MPSADPLARARRRPLFEPGPTSEKTRLGTAAIERLLPHRDPMLLVDVIEAVDLPARRLQASRRIDPSDPVLGGHFPDHPVYPGALLIEAMGQASLCLHQMLHRGRADVRDDDVPLGVRLLRVRQATFQAEVRPGDVVNLLCEQTDDDSFTVTCVAQAMVDGRVCAFAEMDVFIVDDDDD
jgi:3-hydroxymyristoyl/3-hydroxydecanoyl-(acyl carrier protein) dehydratase